MHGPDVLTLLNRDLANEMNAMLMFMVDGLVARGQDALDLRDVAKSIAKSSFKHANKIAARIVELEGVPQLMPMHIQDNASIEAKMPADGHVQAVLTDALESELQAVIEYKNQIQNIGFQDPTTRTLLESILADKEHEVEEVRNLLGI